jgi:acyl carrier protein
VSVSDEAILADLIGIIKGLTDWEYSGPITRETRFFADLGFESIDAVALGEAIEAHYRRRFPYAEFLAGLGERNARDLPVGEVIDFLRPHLDDSAPQARMERTR